MIWLLFLGLAAVVWNLKGNVQRLERRIDELEDRPYAVPERPIAPARPVSVPKTRTRTEVVTAPAPPPPPARIRPEPAPLPRAQRVEEEPRDESFAGRLGVPRVTFDFEDIFGRRLPIWAGGITLALAGIFMVKFSIEAGLLTPSVRVILSFVFGLLLLGGGELAYRFEHKVADPRVRQALAGAGLATLYAAFYLAGTVYTLIGPAAAFAGLAVVTAAAISLSFRFGLPCAVLGLVGGFAAPALVASDEANVPLLAFYLALVTGGLAWTGRRQHRPWLGYLALAGGFVWGGLLLLGGLGEGGDLVALGLYIAVLGAALPLLMGSDPRHRLVRLAAAGLGSLQMAALVETAGNEPLTWGLYLLLGAALAALGWRDREVREGGAFAAVLGLWLLLAWDIPPANLFAAVVSGFAAIFLLVPLVHLWRERARQLDLWQVTLVAPALAAAIYWLFGAFYLDAREPEMAAATAGLALVPALAAVREWRAGENQRMLVIPLASEAFMAIAALLMLSPTWFAPVAMAGVTAALLFLLSRRIGAPLAALCWVVSWATLVMLMVTPFDDQRELARLAGGTAETDLVQSLLRWTAVLVPFAALGWLEQRHGHRRTAEAIAALVGYGLLAQFFPAEWLAWTAAVGAIAITLAWRERSAAAWALGAVAALWAVGPLSQWYLAGMLALAGKPMLIAETIGVRDTLLHLAPLAFAAGTGWWALRDRPGLVAKAMLVLALGLALVIAHVLFKHVLAIGDLERFRQLGMAERTLWQALLSGAGLALLRFSNLPRTRPIALALVGLSLAHFALFTLLLHNPLFVPQAVGSLLLVNWLLPAYALALAGVTTFKRERPERLAGIGPAFDGAAMVLIALFALSTLRHWFAGPVLTATDMSQAEDLLRSLLGIVLALGYLWWGSRSGMRSWRVGSLVLMLLAVFKVFLVDAAGLEGLLRIASFMALGFSLIGIGWVYSRQLARRTAAQAQ